MKKYPKYKKSGIEWIGEIPSEWNNRKIKWITSVKRGASPRPIDDTKYFDDDGEFAWVRIADVTASERYLISTTQKLSELGASSSVKRFPGDFFLSIAGSVGKPMITKIKCCIHDGFVWFPELKINAEYLYYIFQTGLPYQGLGKLGTQLNLNTDSVGSIVIPIPTEAEINKIVNYLDSKTNQIETLIFNKQKLIELLHEERIGVINHAITKGLNPKAKLKQSGISWIGEIPESWKLKKLKYVSKITRGAILRPVDEPSYFDDDGEWTYLNISDATICDKYLYEGKLKLSELGSTKSARVEPNNLIITASATIGKPFINKIPVCIHDGFIPITDLKVDLDFLYYYFKNPQLFNGLGKSNTQKNIYLEDVKNLDVPIPPIKEQLEISKFIESEQTRIDKLIHTTELEIELMKEYKTALISEVVTGKIDVRDEVIK
jgi:type I restriction enzyme S subunit